MSSRAAKKKVEKTDKTDTRKRSGVEPEPDPEDSTAQATGIRRPNVVEQMTQAYGEKVRATRIL